jgi:hypothetical protein
VAYRRCAKWLLGNNQRGRREGKGRTTRDGMRCSGKPRDPIDHGLILPSVGGGRGVGVWAAIRHSGVYISTSALNRID